MQRTDSHIANGRRFHGTGGPEGQADTIGPIIGDADLITVEDGRDVRPAGSRYIEGQPFDRCLEILIHRIKGERFVRTNVAIPVGIEGEPVELAVVRK